ncbi:unnamed protein product, partial [Ilex paraguariensis]
MEATGWASVKACDEVTELVEVAWWSLHRLHIKAEEVLKVMGQKLSFIYSSTDYDHDIACIVSSFHVPPVVLCCWAEQDKPMCFVQWAMLDSVEDNTVVVDFYSVKVHAHGADHMED